MHTQRYRQWAMDGKKRDNQFIELIVTCINTGEKTYSGLTNLFGEPDCVSRYPTWEDCLYFYTMKIKFDTYEMCLSIQTSGNQIRGFHVKEGHMAPVRPMVLEALTHA